MTSPHGRFRKPLDPEALSFSSSLIVDRRLYREDIEGSIAHVDMLAKRRIIPRTDARRIRASLRKILREIENGTIALNADGAGGGRFAGDDVHMAIERQLIRKIGERGGMLHTARSRNDQVALDERLFLRGAITKTASGIRTLQRAFVAKAREFPDLLMPGYTHLQRGQPILLAHHLLAYVSMLERDVDRLMDCRRRVNRSPLGAGALAGTSFPIDRRRTARQLGFDGVMENSIDAVSDRDVQLEFLGACAIIMMHLSRFAEEIVLWSSKEWNFVDIGDAFTTGSSIMPQKKNPDIAELIRGKTGRVYGDLLALLTVMKGLPLSYNRDMQEDKEPLFDAVDTLRKSLSVAARMLRTVHFNTSRFEKELDADPILATELADYLVRKGLPFRKAHAVVGSIVATCSERGISLSELPMRVYRRHSTLFANDIASLFHARSSVVRKRSEGSTSPGEVARALRTWERRLRMRNS